MQVVKKVNDIHPDSVPQRLEPGQVVRYQLLIGTENPDPQARVKKPMIYPSYFQIPSRDRIYDKNKKEYVDIALVENYDAEGNITPRVIAIPGTDHGIISCTGGNYEDEELYEFLELHNRNASNANRNASVEPFFKRIDDEGDSKQRNKQRSTLLEALKYADSMTNGEVKDFAASMNWNENLSIQVLRDKVGEFIEKDAKGFVKAIESKDKDVKALLKKAVTEGVIKYDTAQHKITLNGQTLMSLTRVEGVDYLTQAADWIGSAKNGDKVLATIKKLMDKPKADNQPE